jgi:tetratricopeptide (TPR) repeat protein
MKKIVLILIAFLVLTKVYSQNNYTRVHRDIFDEANLFFYDEDYETALSIYNELYEIDTSYNEINYMIGACMINIRSKEDQAFPYLEKAVAGDIKEANYWLARSYHLKMDFDNALKYYQFYEHYPEKERSDEEIKRYIEMSVLAKEMIENPVEIELINLGPGINSKYSEYVPLISSDQNEIYFTSRRPNGTGGKMDDFGNYFEDIYYSQKNIEDWAPAIDVGPPLNTETHDAAVSLTSNGNEMILYRTNENITGGDLYISQHTITGWGVPVKITENVNSKYQEASAIIAPDGEIMYISSNRPGGFGGKDLYRVRKLPNNEWSLPENLGPTINTAYDEDAPFIHADGVTLYFSSNGLKTMGGYDIFECKLDENGFWSIPKNMGYPLNTVKDDIYFVMGPDGKTGYYSSDMSGGYGQQDIYKINILYDKKNRVIIKGQTVDLLSQESIKSRITVIDQYNRDIVGYYLSNSVTGKFVLILQPDRNYKIIIEANGYQEFSRQIRVDNDEDSWLQEVDKKFELIQLTGK